MPSKERVCWDSCVIIDLLQQTPNRIAVLREYTERSEMGDLVIVVSTFAMVEVAQLRDLQASDDEKERLIEAFFNQPYIARHAVDTRVSKRARQIMRTTSIKGKDAVHIATALVAGAPILHTYEER